MENIMSKVDNFIEKFFEKIKKRQADRMIKDVRKKNPGLAKKLDKIDDAYSDLDDYLRKKYGKIGEK